MPCLLHAEPLDRGYRLAVRAAATGSLPLRCGCYVGALALQLVRCAQGVDVAPSSPAALALNQAIQLAAPAQRSLAFEVETLALGDASPATIAAHVGVSVQAVHAFEELFFDARGRLDSRMFIMDAAIRPELRRPPRDDVRRRAAKKIIAYLCGADAYRHLYLPRDPTHPWREPTAALEQLQLETSLDCLADLAFPRDGTVGDVKQLQAAIETAVAQLRSRRAMQLPSNQVERDAAELQALVGGGALLWSPFE